MPGAYNMHYAKTHLSRLAERAAQGEVILISRNGRPLAQLGPIEQARKERKSGLWKGKVWIADDFDDPLPWEIQRYFEGEDDDEAPS